MNDLGKQGEALVLRHYQALGFSLVAQNYIFRRGKQTGEIDLIVRKGRELVFIEVKTRSNSRFGNALDSVDYSKQRKLVRTLKLYLQQHLEFLNNLYRFDVAAVDIDNVEKPVIIIPNAIEDVD